MFERVISRVRVGTLYEHIRNSDPLLLVVLSAAEGITELKGLLQKISNENIHQVVRFLTDSEAKDLQEKITLPGLMQRTTLASEMDRLAKLETIPADFQGKTGIILGEVNWGAMKTLFQQGACCYYRSCVETIFEELWSRLPEGNSLLNHYQTRFQQALPALDDLDGWRQLAKQVSFSLILVDAYEDYCRKKGADKVNDDYKRYVFEQPARHTLVELCSQVSKCCGWFGHLHKNSFLTQVLEQRDIPWHKELFAPLFVDDLQAVYDDRLYLPGAGGQERMGGNFFKPASRVARDQVLAAVEEYVETDLCVAFA